MGVKKATKVVRKPVAKPVPAPVPVTEPTPVAVPVRLSVSQLLATSYAFHNQSLPSKGVPRNRAALKSAADLRLEALEIDPNRIEPAWAEEDKRTPGGTNTHEALMAFYKSQGVA